MGSKRVFAISRRRRGYGRAAVILGALALGALTIALGGCGRSGHGVRTDSEKAADVEILNSILAHELTVVDAYSQALPQLRGEALAVARQFQGQDQAHVDAVTKAIRGVGGETDAEAEELETPGPRTREGALQLAYEEENAALSQTLGSVPHLQTAAPRMLAGALAASHAQHVAALRQLLGADLDAKRVQRRCRRRRALRGGDDVGSDADHNGEPILERLGFQQDTRELLPSRQYVVRPLQAKPEPVRPVGAQRGLDADLPQARFKRQPGGKAERRCDRGRNIQHFKNAARKIAARRDPRAMAAPASGGLFGSDEPDRPALAVARVRHGFRVGGPDLVEGGEPVARRLGSWTERE